MDPDELPSHVPAVQFSRGNTQATNRREPLITHRLVHKPMKAPVALARLWTTGLVTLKDWGHAGVNKVTYGHQGIAQLGCSSLGRAEVPLAILALVIFRASVHVLLAPETLNCA